MCMHCWYRSLPLVPLHVILQSCWMMSGQKHSPPGYVQGCMRCKLCGIAGMCSPVATLCAPFCTLACLPPPFPRCSELKEVNPVDWRPYLLKN